VTTGSSQVCFPSSTRSPPAAANPLGPTTVGVTLIAIAMGFNHTLIAKLKQASFAFGRKQQKKSTAPSLPGP
jgi:hypothetical protein